ncbi:preprotein translocase subunit SecE [Candidatus Methylacidithermus pantelleriae]|uniref:Preprotein translocase subunit SecE n=1 Tax=Candidatus Methylacidithermus pantelleriae TaxID=2744239 RepID=A0A8J2FVG9_9BACT|nr:preprotein translocase subunit SecE [Candidatus Methylacidithermus pantelleriae]CAF0693057.1 Preprotein translocase subunit SecE [Candidatus Methylacidithermus pantelleriae]
MATSQSALLDWITYGLLAVAVGGIGWLLYRDRKKIRVFLEETWVELKKCSWPWDPAEKGPKKFRELIDSTVVVVISSILLASIVTSIDFLLAKVVGFLTRLRV